MSNRSLIRICLVVALVVASSNAGAAQSPAQSDEAAQGFVVQALTWKRSDVWTGDQFGPTDAAGRAWHHPQFDDSNWQAVALPDSHLSSTAHDRYYRARFNWDGSSMVSVYFISDDGLSIFINGQQLGSWGKGWRQSGCVNPAPGCFNFTPVPTQTIPSAMLQPGSNVIAIDRWNAATCCFAYLDVTLYGSGKPPVNPTKTTPILFVLGWRGAPNNPPGVQNCTSDYKNRFVDDETVDAYFNRLDDDLRPHYPLYYAHLITNPCWTPPLAENAKHLKNSIERAKNAEQRRTGVRPVKVILVGHSMGGLVSRAYVEGSSYSGDVEAIFTLGSPHDGVPIESLIDYLELIDAKGAGYITLGVYCLVSQPAVCEFSETGMRIFNLLYKRRAGVRYYTISGNAPFGDLNNFGKVMSLLIEGPDDGIVPTLSGNGLDDAGVLALSTDENHGSFGLNNYFKRGAEPAEPSRTFTDCLSKVLVSGSLGEPCVARAVSAGQDGTERFTSRVPLATNVLRLNEILTREVSVEGGPALFAAQAQTGTLSFTLVAPDGSVIDPAFAAANPGLVTHKVEDGIAIYEIAAAQAGTWKMVTRMSDAPPDGAEVITFAAFGGDLQIQAAADRLWYAPGSTAILTATLSGAITSATVTATLSRADGVTDALTLIQTSPGVFRGEYVAPNAPGYVEVKMLAKGIATSGAPFERGTSFAFQIAPATAALNGAFTETPQPRSPGSSFYAAIDIGVGVLVNAGGKVGLAADLVDASGRFVARANATYDVIPGSTTLTLRFAGEDIYASRRDGPYRLTNLVLTDQSAAPLVLAERTDAYITAAYRHTAFGHGKVYLPAISR
ncbi:MAG: beta galactosidase jelly roll domain-containing protein [Anaerolineae bacterium]|nr:GPI inositol-deacylase [Candidatus Roseilinea sp.]MDW8449546.1 beta galactosidase jelly roll domain-containing protein [Anaerolineae bacterium]